MALSPTEEAQVRSLIAQNPALLNLAASESTIISKLGATKTNLSALSAATSLSDSDIALVRQGLSDRSFALSVLLDYVQNNFRAASETDAGIVELATALEAQALVNDQHALTPKKLADSFKGGNQSLSSNGYQKLPGGLIIQWGGRSNPGDVMFPVAFPNQLMVIAHSFTDLTMINGEQIAAAPNLSRSLTGFTLTFASVIGGIPYYNWIAIGR